MIAKILLKSNREKSILRHHPWIFSGAIADLRGSPTMGETVRVHSSDDQFLCWAAYSPTSQIIGRIWSWDEDEVIDESFFWRKISKATQLRNEIVIESNALRLVNAESDGIPGLIVDQYLDVLVVQFLSAGVEYWKDSIVSICSEISGVQDIYERSDVDVRKHESLPQVTGRLRGNMPKPRITIQERDCEYIVDVKHGHKTGFYLDQRDNRQKLATISAGREVLDCFSYTGAFTVTALKNGAKSVTTIDSSAESLNIVRENIYLNRLSDEHVKIIEGDVFQELRTMRDRNASFDIIILDPPKFAPTKSFVRKASRGYKDINLLAIKLLRPGGFLVTFSCSGAIEEPLFQKIVSDAASDAKADVSIIDRLSQASDHPVALNFPEGAYLKGFILYKVE